MFSAVDPRFSLQAIELRPPLEAMDFPEELANPDLVGALVKVSLLPKENPRNPELLALELGSKTKFRVVYRAAMITTLLSPRRFTRSRSTNIRFIVSYSTSTSYPCFAYVMYTAVFD